VINGHLINTGLNTLITTNRIGIVSAGVGL